MVSLQCHEQCSLGIGGTFGSVEVLVEMTIQKKVRNYIIYPDLLKKVMFSKPLPLTGGTEMGDLFQNKFLVMN